MSMTKYIPKRGRPAIDPRKKARAKSLAEGNPTLNMTDIAQHVEVSPTTVAKWFDEWKRKRWYT